MKLFHFVSIFALMTFASVQDIIADDGDFELYLVAQDNSYTSLDYANLKSLVFSQEREDLDGDGVKAYENYLTVNKKDGSSTVFNLSSSVAIMFADKAMGIGYVEEQAIPISINGKSIKFNKAGKIEVYQTDGRLVRTIEATEGDSTELTELGKGVYVVKLGSFVVKILVR